MRKSMVCVCVTFLLGCAVFAQKNERPKVSVIWSSDPNCHQNNSAEVKALRPQCSTAKVDLMTFYIISFDGLSYAMSYRPVRDYLVASVQISNKSDAPLEVNPKRSRLGRFKSAEEYAGNVRPEYAAAKSQDELRQAQFRESELLGERDGEIRSGLRLMEKYEENKARGRVIKRTDRNEPAAPQTEDPAPSFITSNLRVPREVFDFVLKPRTLAAGEKTAGHLVFKNAEEQNTYLVWYLNAGQIEFVFPGQSN